MKIYPTTLRYQHRVLTAYLMLEREKLELSLRQQRRR